MGLLRLVFHQPRVPFIVQVFDVQSVICSDVRVYILLFQGRFRNKRTRTVWFPAILKQSSGWLLFLATGEFPALGPGSEAPGGL